MIKTILMVEDEIVTSKAVSSMLKKYGYKSIIANSGLEAISIINTEKDIGLILMDIELGDGIDGAETARMILAARSIPIVFLTSDPEKDYIDRVKDITRYGYVLKNSGNFLLLSSIEIAFELFNAHKKMRESEEKYRLVFDYSPLGLVHFDKNGLISTCNDIFVEIIGSSRSALIGLDMLKLPDEKIKEAVLNSLDGNPGYYEGIYKSVTADKSTPVRIVFAPLKSHDGNVIGGVGVVEDITESKRVLDLLKRSYDEMEATNEELTATNEEFEAMNEELISSYQQLFLEKDKTEERERNYREIFDSSNDAIFIHDSKTGLILDVNKTMLKMYGFTDKDEVINASIKNLTAFGEDLNNEKAVKIMQKSLEFEYKTTEWHAKKKSGELFWVEVSFKKTKINGESRIMATVRDITEKRKFEEAAQNAQKLESLGVLAGGIAHDFNNLLSGIFGSIDLAKMKNIDSNLNSYFDGAMSSIDRARDLTQQLLTFSRGGTPIMKPGSLSPFLQDTVQFALSGSNVSCRFFIPDGLPHCFFDKNQIAQVIDNLIINAQQAMPLGGIIDVSAKNIFLKKQEHAILRSGMYVLISIKDRGIGISKELLPFIFDPFFTTKAKGHGLGLATCYSIINRHGGAIEVESVPGEGSSFNIFLPESSEYEDIPDEKPEICHSGKGRILVMDDEEMILKILTEMLSEFGYSVVTMRDGRDAVNYFVEENRLNNKFAAMIFDLTVPGGLGGFETIKEIRKIDQDIPIFVSSGYSEDPVMANPCDFGFTSSIRKPFKISELSEMLDKFIVKNY